ncbi:MAG: Ni/Fe-hydrogenase cytochrome b subunit [Candidatus Krumholzibacteriia bacterium]
MSEGRMLCGRQPFFSAGAVILLAVMAIGYSFGIARLVAGLAPVTNLSDQYPWGLWIAVDVASGVALAAGGFTVAAVVNIFGRRKYRSLERPALLTAWLGYIFVAVGLLFDLGRYYNIWHPLIYWQGNSVLFEVGMCVMCYLLVLTVEFAPTLLTGLDEHLRERQGPLRWLTGLKRPLRALQEPIRHALPLFIVAGVVFSFMHQSSLGSLMLIAPTKLSPLWWTPILPVLFLLSAIMVGLPVVILESIAASRAFGREPEMSILTPLSRILPWLLGVYGVVKVADLFWRHDLSVFRLDAGDSAAWLVEVGVGVLIPFVMLLREEVRRSPRGLCAAVSLIIGGVVLNRINVFLVGFHPPFGERGYFPSFGEVALTAALVSTLILLYRFFVFYFPVLPADGSEAPRTAPAAAPPAGLGPWVGRALAAAMIIGIIVVYADVHFAAPESTRRAVGELTYQADHTALGPAHGPTAPPPGPAPFAPNTMPALLWIDHQVTNAQIDDYAASRFMHRAHASRLGGQCAVCHHRAPQAPGDRIGRRVEAGDGFAQRPVPCASCHQQAGEPDRPLRAGLKGAFHQRCLGCHESSGGAAPTACDACHHRHVPDHADLIRLASDPAPRQLTARCLECHPQQGRDLLRSAHWNWAGPSPYTVGAEHRSDLGKHAVFNNYCIHVGSNIARCTQCHVGYGWVDDSFDFDDPTGIDCLVCHCTNGAYRKAEPSGGMPAEGVDLLAAAQSVGRPSRETCGRCHFYGGGGANVKHGDLEPALVAPSDELDVHMGRHDLLCQDCHTTRRHRVAGQCSAIPTSEGRVTCEHCHGPTPHSLGGILGFHLDEHVASVACQTCHIPNFAREAPTKIFWDWSTAGTDLPEEIDRYGMALFSRQKGSFTWAKNQLPCYAWYNGKHRRYLLGDTLAADGDPVLNQPQGSFLDPAARIHPFKCFAGLQPMDAGNRTLAVPNLWQGLWQHGDWDRAIRDGMAAVDLPYSGEFTFTRTRMFWSINHEVVPAEQALRCADCHRSEAVNCVQCHDRVESFEATAGLIGPVDAAHAGGRLDFVALGYEGDPAVVGMRWRQHTRP